MGLFAVIIREIGGQPAGEGSGSRGCTRFAEYEEAGDSADSTCASGLERGRRSDRVPESGGGDAGADLRRRTRRGDLPGSRHGLDLARADRGSIGNPPPCRAGSETFLQDLGGMVEDFGPGTETEDPAIAKLAARFLHLSMAAARQAYVDAGLDREGKLIDPHRAAVVIGLGIRRPRSARRRAGADDQRRSLAVSPYLVPAMIINQAAGQIAQHLRLYGPSAAPANACASGGHAIVLGAMFLRSGEADIALLRCGRECIHAGGGQRIRDDEGALWAQAGRSIGRRSGAGEPAVQHRPGGLRAGGRGRRGRAGDRIGRPKPRARCPGRAGGLGDELRRPPHGHAVSGAYRRTAWRPRLRARELQTRDRSITTTLTARAPCSTTGSKRRS